MATLIKNGILCLPSGETKGDLLLEEDKIAALGSSIEYDPAKTKLVDATDCLVFPGFIDTHTHMALDNGSFVSPDDFFHGTKAALLGGTTTILDFATQGPGESLQQALANWQTLAEKGANCDYGFHMAITNWNQEISREILEMADLGVTSFKVYMAYDNLRLRDEEIFRILEKVGEVGGILGCHCENGDLIKVLTENLVHQGKTNVAFHPQVHLPVVEAEGVYRYLTIGKAAGVPINIVHLSTQEGLELVKRARAEGQEVYVETCPQYLLLDQSNYDLDPLTAAVSVLSPPLRARADQEALWQGIAAGQIDTIGTDHCSFNLRGQKDKWLNNFSRIPNGIPGVEHRPALIYTYGVTTGKISLSMLVRLLAANPAKVFGLYPQKGILAPGSDGDVVLWDPRAEGWITAANQAHNVDNTPYEGLTIKGRVKAVYLRGKEVVRNGILIEENRGNYLARGASLSPRTELKEM